MIKRISIAAAMLGASSLPAFAHITADHHHSFSAGFKHPIFGADHVLAMVAVGLWASQISSQNNQKTALWAVPLAFVSFMAIGFLMAALGAGLPFVEPAILASVIALGLLVAIAASMPTSAASAIVGIFALFHGYAHGTEMHGANAVEFGIGFIAATMLLHIAGIALGLGLTRLSTGLSRLLGGLTAVAGLSLAFAG
jgi:urease accessory protein